MSNWLVVVEPELSYLFPDLRLSIWQLSALLCYVSPFYSLSLIYNSDVAANPNCGFLIPITNLFFRFLLDTVSSWGRERKSAQVTWRKSKIRETLGVFRMSLNGQAGATRNESVNRYVKI